MPFFLSLTHSSVASFSISVRKVENFSILNLSIHITTNIIAFLFFMNGCGSWVFTTTKCHRNCNRSQFNCIYSALSKTAKYRNETKSTSMTLMKESNEIFTWNVAEGSNRAMKALIDGGSSKVRIEPMMILNARQKKQINCNQSQNQNGCNISAKSKENPIYR